MEAEVIYYCEDHDNVDFSKLSDCFGKPEDVAKDFLSELGESAAVEAHSIKRKILHFTVAIVVVVAIGIVFHICYVQHTLLDVHYVESITSEGNIASYSTAPIYSAETFSNDVNTDE